MKILLKLLVGTFVIMFAMYGCDLYEWSDFREFKRHGNDFIKSYGSSTVLKWDEALSMAVDGNLTVPVESRIYAMVTLAVHDALNNVIPKYETYALDNGDFDAKLITRKNISSIADAAVSQSAHDVLVSLVPGSVVRADSLLDVILSGIEESEYKNAGIQIGHDAAQAVLTARQNDVMPGFDSYAQGTEPGQYQSTIPFKFPNLPVWPANAVYGQNWGETEPFGILSGDQFRSELPHDINSPQYTEDYNEVMTLGSNTSLLRTAEQTEMGIFLTDNMPGTWNRVARIIVKKEKLNGWESARLLALLHMTEADALIAAFDGAFFYNFWRPVTAINEGDNDENDDTAGDPAWTPLTSARPTPPLPAYPSGYAAAGVAGAETLKMFFKTDRKSFTIGSYSLPGAERSYSSFSQLADEMGVSRIYAGHNFRNDNTAGNILGKKVAKFVYENNLRENKY